MLGKDLPWDGNLYPARGYVAQPDPNGSDFTRLDKFLGGVWVFLIKKKKKNLKRVWVFAKT